jgi:DNA repair exonuclease SbcCD nuclease subunit
MRFVHSSDLQIGKGFVFLEPDVGVLLQNARLEAVTRLGEIAVQHEAFTVLLAGDIFDKQRLSNVTVAKPVEIMRRFSTVTWHLMPGNHDHVRENGLWGWLALHDATVGWDRRRCVFAPTDNSGYDRLARQ